MHSKLIAKISSRSLPLSPPFAKKKEPERTAQYFTFENF
jgi:hypothetical protein